LLYFLETPYLKIAREVENKVPDLENRILDQDVAGAGKAGTQIDSALAKKIAGTKNKTIKIKPFITKEIEYLDATDEDRKVIAHAGIKLDASGNVEENSFL
jgi:DNA-directed RNA polymerase subunit beta